MAKGNYAGAEDLAAKGREIQKFQGEVDSLRDRWRAIRGGGSTGGRRQETPLWGFYQPILKALVQKGGTATRQDIESTVGQLMSSEFKAGDRDAGRAGQERWRGMIRRARKHLVSEGWIERGNSPTWRITDLGRRAAERPPKPAAIS
jgi:hypothetical protein